MELKNFSHPLAVAERKVVVHRHEMNPFTSKCIQIHRQRGDQSLAFARGHLGDFPLVQHDPPDELHVEGHHVP